MEILKSQTKTVNLKYQCNDTFEVPDGSSSVSDIQDYFEYIIKNAKHGLIIFHV